MGELHIFILRRKRVEIGQVTIKEKNDYGDSKWIKHPELNTPTCLITCPFSAYQALCLMYFFSLERAGELLIYIEEETGEEPPSTKRYRVRGSVTHP